DEAARTPVLLYFFSGPAQDRARAGLDALNRRLDHLARLHARVLAVSPAPLDELKKLQADHKLRFPLLHDDRGFSAAYGVTDAPALVLVGPQRRILWLARPAASVEEALPLAEKTLEEQASPATGYPKSVINRWIDKLVS
ncbi:MAG TPA: hypothetical protein DD490_13365, partial [Acidobacteria bacterium]|nr:hypothetical protein [Acidobacteriota bacterium]